MITEEKMLQNFLYKYGPVGLKKITKMFIERESNQIIANHFRVTRQRVHQWQKAFVDQKVLLKPYVQKILQSRD